MNVIKVDPMKEKRYWQILRTAERAVKRAEDLHAFGKAHGASAHADDALRDVQTDLTRLKEYALEVRDPARDAEDLP